MKKSKIIVGLLFSVLFLFIFVFAGEAKTVENPYGIFAEQLVGEEKSGDIEVYPGGMPFGVTISTKGLLVVGFPESEVNGVTVAKDAGMKVGDFIIEVNGKEILSVQDYLDEIEKGKELNVTVERDQQKINLQFTPALGNDGKYKTGVFVKDTTAGIGTVSFIIPENNAFGGLGHGIFDSATGKLIPLSYGMVFPVTINGVVKGKVGTAGELKGTFGSKKIGTLTSNTQSGVFGVVSENAFTPVTEKLKVASIDEVKTGKAYILSTLDESGPKKYEIEITEVVKNENGQKNFKIKVTDPALLEKSGGIVQGMSGSPIIQNNKLIGAVTHVLINDPKSGYGISIENMLSAMPDMLK